MITCRNKKDGEMNMKTRKSFMGRTIGAALMAMGLLSAGCDWTTGGDGYGSRIDINFSGTYNGQQSGRAVTGNDGRAITRFVISQVGDTVDVFDNNGGRYRGRISQAGSVTQAEGGAFAAGTQLAQAQLSWSGTNPATGREVRFVGNIAAVAVRDIQSTSSGSSSTTVDSTERTTTSVQNNGTTTTTTTTVTVGTPGSALYLVTTTVVVTDNTTGAEIRRTSTTEDRSNRESSQEFSLTAQNTQYLLTGNWIESGGPTGNVRALAAGSAGSIGGGGAAN
jgi:hypothetical protein